VLSKAENKGYSSNMKGAVMIAAFAIFVIYAQASLSYVISQKYAAPGQNETEQNETATMHYIERIGVQVGSNGCNCNMRLTICAGEGNSTCCMTDDLDSENNDFESDDYNMFANSTETLGNCTAIAMPAGEMISLIAYHDGSDAVDIDYWDILFGDNTYETCHDGNNYDNDDYYMVYC